MRPGLTLDKALDNPNRVLNSHPKSRLHALFDVTSRP